MTEQATTETSRSTLSPEDENPAIEVPRSLRSKKPMRKKLISMLPSMIQLQKPLKASLSLLLAVVLTLDLTTRAAIGQGALLVVIVSLFYFPVRTIGVHVEAIIYGTAGALIGAAWCFLGIFVGNLARDANNPNPIQSGSSVVLAVFLFFGVFVINYVRTHVPKANFACVNACILLTFSLTESAIVSGFQPELVWTFFEPIVLAAGTTLAVNCLLWPDDSVSNYLVVLIKTLSDSNVFFQEHLDGFLSIEVPHIESSMPKVHSRLQGNILLLIDCKRAVQRDILYSRLSNEDISKLTKLAKRFRVPLHSIGLSYIAKVHYLQDEDPDHPVHNHVAAQTEVEALNLILQELRGDCKELVDACLYAIDECIQYIESFKSPPRSNLSCLLWPFPRLFEQSKPIKEKDLGLASLRLREALKGFHGFSRETYANLVLKHLGDRPSVTHRLLYLAFAFQYGLQEYSKTILELIEMTEDLNKKRLSKRFWFPRMSFRKWFNSEHLDTPLRDDLNGYSHDDGHDLTLVRTVTWRDTTDRDPKSSKIHSAQRQKGSGLQYADPDVEPPANRTQAFFSFIYKIECWFYDNDTFFAFKTAIGVVLLSLPGFLSQSATWFFEWRGQWAMITLVLWMMPTAGMQYYALIMRLAGTVSGGVFGIIAWEISRGNPYGLTAVLFVFIFIHYYVFILKPLIRMASFLSNLTMLLVTVYEYNYVVDQVPDHDQVYTVAGKRCMLVAIGVLASAILTMIPYVVTGRVELRKRLARTIRDVGKVYGVLVAMVTAQVDSTSAPTPGQEKAFRKLALDIHRQIEEERNLLKHARFEPPLRGKFPQEKYEIIIAKVDNLVDLVHSMAYVVDHMGAHWRTNISTALALERQDYRASIMTTLQLVSSTLAAKVALPPYLISPDEALERFAAAIERKSKITSEELASPHFPSFCTYMMCSTLFTHELNVLLKTVESLVGVDDPNQWLQYYV